MPIVYGVIYLIMGSREGFAENMLLGWIYIIIPLVLIETILSCKKWTDSRNESLWDEVVENSTKETPKSVSNLLFLKEQVFKGSFKNFLNLVWAWDFNWFKKKDWERKLPKGNII